MDIEKLKPIRRPRRVRVALNTTSKSSCSSPFKACTLVRIVSPKKAASSRTTKDKTNTRRGKFIRTISSGYQGLPTNPMPPALRIAKPWFEGPAVRMEIYQLRWVVSTCFGHEPEVDT